MDEEEFLLRLELHMRVALENKIFTSQLKDVICPMEPIRDVGMGWYLKKNSEDKSSE